MIKKICDKQFIANRSYAEITKIKLFIEPCHIKHADILSVR